MERLDRIASHDGIVTAVHPGRVTVQIESVSACATCAAHGRCGFAESKQKEVEVPSSDWKSYTLGQQVTVHIDESRGMLAVWLAYVLPAILLIADIVILSLLQLPEWVVVLSAFFVLALYLMVLYLRRRKVENRFTLTLSPLTNH